MSLGSRIREVRKDVNLTGDEFCKVIGISPVGTLYKYERGDNLPNVMIIKKICLEFDVNGHWLVTGKGAKFIGEASNRKFTGQSLEERVEKIERKLRDLGDEYRG